jgi:hypothetical protein
MVDTYEYILIGNITNLCNVNYNDFFIDTNFEGYLKIISKNGSVITFYNKLKDLSTSVVYECIKDNYKYFEINLNPQYFNISYNSHYILINFEIFSLAGHSPSFSLAGHSPIYENGGLCPPFSLNCIIPPEKLLPIYKSSEHPDYEKLDLESYKMHIKKCAVLLSDNLYKSNVLDKHNFKNREVIVMSNSKTIFKCYISEYNCDCIVKIVLFDKLFDDYMDSYVHDIHTYMDFIQDIPFDNFEKLLGYQVSDNLYENIFGLSIKYNGSLIYVYKYIEGKSLKDKVIYMSHNELKEVLYNLLTLLHKLYKLYDFTHYDLNLNNIIISDNEVYLIDYESCYYKDKDDIPHYNQYFDIHPNNKKNWIHDVFKILMWLWKYTNIDLLVEKIEEDKNGELSEISLKLSGGTISNLNKSITKKYDDIKSIINKEELDMNNKLISDILSYFCGMSMNRNLHDIYHKCNIIYSIKTDIPEQDYDKFIEFITPFLKSKNDK